MNAPRNTIDTPPSSGSIRIFDLVRGMPLENYITATLTVSSQGKRLTFAHSRVPVKRLLEARMDGDIADLVCPTVTGKGGIGETSPMRSLQKSIAREHPSSRCREAVERVWSTGKGFT